MSSLDDFQPGVPQGPLLFCIHTNGIGITSLHMELQPASAACN